MEQINEHDITRKMLNNIRDINVRTTYHNRGMINENLNGDNEEEELTSAELSEEQKNFRDTVSPRVEFSTFTVYPKAKNVVFSGKFKNLGGLEWQFTLEDSDVLYISA